MNAQLRSCAEADLPHLVPLLTRAFMDDPMAQFVLPDTAHRTMGLPWMQRMGTRLGLQRGAVFATPEFTGSAVWLAPGEHHLTEERLAAAGLADAFEPMGLEALGRLQFVMQRLGEVHDTDVPVPHWYLMILGVDPAHQRTGLGSALLTPMLRRADAEGRPCFLNTMKEANLAFYARHGFRVVRDEVLAGTPLRYWNLRRDPDASTT